MNSNSPETVSSGSHKNGSKYSLVFFGVGLAGIVVMVCTMDVSAVDWSTALRLMPIWLPALLLLWAVIYAVHTFAWQAIMGEDCRGISFWRLYRIGISGFAINHVTPAGLMGGEPYRIMELKATMSVEKATAHSVSFSITQTFSHLLFWTGGTVIYFAMYTAVSSVLRTVLMSLSGVVCLSLCLLYFFTHEEHLASRLFLFLCRVPLVKRFAVRFVEKNAESLNQVDREMVAFRKRKKPFLLSFFLEYLTWCMEVFEYFLIFRLLGANLSIWQSALALSVASMIGNLMFFVPMQVGSREGGLALVLRWFDVRGSLGVSAALFARIREIFYIALGVLMILTSSHKCARKKKKENE